MEKEYKKAGAQGARDDPGRIRRVGRAAPRTRRGRSSRPSRPTRQGAARRAARGEVTSNLNDTGRAAARRSFDGNGRPMLPAFVRAVYRLSTACAVVAALMLLIAALVITWSIVYRAMGASTYWEIEFSVFMMVGSLFLASPYCLATARPRRRRPAVALPPRALRPRRGHRGRRRRAGGVRLPRLGRRGADAARLHARRDDRERVGRRQVAAVPRHAGRPRPDRPAVRRRTAPRHPGPWRATNERTADRRRHPHRHPARAVLGPADRLGAHGRGGRLPAAVQGTRPRSPTCRS